MHKVYDRTRTPYLRLLEAGVLAEVKQQELATIYHALNPVSLLRQINEHLEHLWNLAKRSQQHKGKSHNDAVTATYDATIPVR